MKGLLVLISTLFLSSSVFGAGFLDHVDGEPYRWNGTITYHVDNDSLGDISHAAAKTLVGDSLATWENISIATIDFQEGSDLAVNIAGPGQANLDDCTQGNWDDYIYVDESGAPRTADSVNDSIVIFDSDGSIIDCLLGVGNSLNVLGLASPGNLDDETMTITNGLILINGRNASSANADRIQATITHETGHLLNLAHTQLNHEEAFDDDSDNDYVIPTMFPYLPDDFDELNTPEADDEFSLAYLYPASSYADMGMIQGSIRRRNGDGVRGVSVYCRDTSNSLVNAVSWISDFVEAGEGEYWCGNLTSGNYQVEIEPIFLAINYFDPYPPFVVEEFYSGDVEGADPATDLSKYDGANLEEPDEVRTSIAVAAGETVSDIDIVLNEDGRLRSGQAVTGTSKGFFPSMEYFIKVPEGASGIRFDLVAEDNNVDLDLLVKCAPEFSLPFMSTVPSLVTSSGDSQQAEFSSTSLQGTEQIVIEGESLSACTYHILIPNFSSEFLPSDGILRANYISGSSANFELTATVLGADPRLNIVQGPGTLQDGGTGEILVASRTFRAFDDDIELEDVSFTDSGPGDLSTVSSVQLYLDADEDGSYEGENDRLLASSTVDASTRKVVFEDLNRFIEENETETYLLTYTVSEASSSASLGVLFAILMLGMLLTFRTPLRRGVGVLLLFCVLGVGSCGSSSRTFEPDILEGDVTVTGMTFGSNVSVCVNNAESVSEYFQCR